MYLNVVQLAESFGVEEDVVEDWVRKGGLPAVEDRGRLLFDRRQVVLWAAERGLVARAGFLASGSFVGGHFRGLEAFLRTGGIWRDVPAVEVRKVLERVVGALPGATPEVKRILAERLRAADGITWAPVGHGIALPHLRSRVVLGRDSGLIAILLLGDELSIEDAPPDGIGIKRLIFFLAPSPRAHLEILSQLSTALTRGSLRGLLERGGSDDEFFAAIRSDQVHPDASTKGRA